MEIEGMELVQTLFDCMRHLDDCLRDMEVVGKELARKENALRLAKGRETVELREGRTPVALIPAIRDRNIAQKWLERDLEQVKYDVVVEDINITKKKLSIVNEVIDRDYRAS